MTSQMCQNSFHHSTLSYSLGAATLCHNSKSDHMTDNQHQNDTPSNQTHITRTIRQEQQNTSEMQLSLLQPLTIQKTSAKLVKLNRTGREQHPHGRIIHYYHTQQPTISEKSLQRRSTPYIDNNICSNINSEP